MFGNKNGDRNSFVGDWFRSIIAELKQLKEGFNSSTGQYGGGGIDNISSKTDSIKTDTAAITNLLTQINSKMKIILVVTQAEYDLIDPKDPNTIYLITQDTQP